MNKAIFLLIVVFFVAIFSCEKEEIIDINNGVLSGTWKLTKYADPGQKTLIEEPSDIYRSIVLIFKDNADSGSINGQTVVNNVIGKYYILNKNKMSVLYFGGTKVGEPEWGSMFWNAIMKSSSYHVGSTQMKIFYDDDSKYMLFEKADEYFHKLYWEQTKCADPWKTNETHSNNATADSIKSYLGNMGITIYDVSFTNESKLDIYCEACICGTGQRIIITSRENDVAKLKALGFKEIE